FCNNASPRRRSGCVREIASSADSRICPRWDARGGDCRRHGSPGGSKILRPFALRSWLKSVITKLMPRRSLPFLPLTRIILLHKKRDEKDTEPQRNKPSKNSGTLMN